MILNEAVYLEHFGVKGMKWGVRKDRVASSEFRDKDFVTKDDVFRIVSQTGSRPLTDIAYVSTNKTDNDRYIHIMNNTLSARLFKDSRMTEQLVLGVKEPIKAPSLKRTEDELSKLYASSKSMQKFVKDNELYFGQKPDAKKLAHIVNTALVDDDVMFTGAVAMRSEVKAHFKKLGYNALLDQNDIGAGLAKTPVVVFDPEQTLRFVSSSAITDVIQRNAKVTYKETKASGWT